jgi:hypothetical protein
MDGQQVTIRADRARASLQIKSVNQFLLKGEVK